MRKTLKGLKEKLAELEECDTLSSEVIYGIVDSDIRSGSYAIYCSTPTRDAVESLAGGVGFLRWRLFGC